MALTRTLVETSFKAMRTAMPGAVVNARFRRKVVQGLQGSLDQTEEVSNLGPIPGAIGAARFLVSELTKPYPKANDMVQFQESAGRWDKRLILAARIDPLKATVRLDYGNEFA